MEITEKTIQEQIPYYLTQEAKQGLVKALKDFPQSTNYHTVLWEDEILQGDIWNRFEVFNFDSGERKEIKGIILSNSCDISSDNQRDLPVNLTFAPVVNLENFKKKLSAAGIDQKTIENKLLAIKEQRVTSLFFLPKGGALAADYIALLGNVHTMPFRRFESKVDRIKQFTLSQVGFYLFLLKLSIHFCRFHENILRDEPSA